MAEVTFLIPEKDRDHVQGLRGVAGVEDARVVHKPFDPYGADAETQVVAEAAVTISYDPATTSVERIRDAFRSLGIHVLDMQGGE